MGDIIEVSAWQGLRNIFYKVSSSGLLFEVKAGTFAVIGLAKRPDGRCNILVVLGHHANQNRTWIKRTDEMGKSGKSCRTPNLLSNNEYRKFWLSWHNGCVQLGRANEKEPIVSLPYNNALDLGYITFSSGGHGVLFERNTVFFRFEMPPLLERPKLKAISGGELQWIHADNQLPDGALIGGYEKETLYIIRAPHRGSLTPGKFVPSHGTGYIAWGGREEDKNEFEVLCGFNCTWVATEQDRIPVSAVEGGYSERDREKLYVGRVLYNGYLIPGKVQPSHRVCYIPYDGREIGLKKYEILVAPDTNSRSATRLFLDHVEVSSPPVSDVEDDDEEAHEPDVYEMHEDYELIQNLG